MLGTFCTIDCATSIVTTTKIFLSTGLFPGLALPKLDAVILLSVHGSLRNQHIGIISMKIESLLVKIKHFRLHFLEPCERSTGVQGDREMSGRDWG
jgi:hypothetical protein